MGSGCAVVDATNETKRGQSTSWDLLPYVLTFSTCLTDISFQCFTMTSVVTWTTSTWIGLTSLTLWRETKKLKTLTLVTEVELSQDK